MRIYLTKAWSAFMEMLGRTFLFNLDSPPVWGVVRDVRYGGSDRRKNTLDIFFPEGQPPYPVLVFVHGGGFHFMDKKSYARVSRRFASAGYLVFNINYRLAPRHPFPAAFEDVGRAVRFAYDNAPRLGGDSGCMFMGGDSAGAYLTAMYGAALPDPRLQAGLSIEDSIPPESMKVLLLFYGAFDLENVLTTGFPKIEMMSRGFMGGDPATYAERAEKGSPARRATASLPPSFITSGERDKLHSESAAFDRVLDDLGVHHRTLFFDRKYLAVHGFLMAPFLRCSKMAFADAIEFMDSQC